MSGIKAYFVPKMSKSKYGKNINKDDRVKENLNLLSGSRFEWSGGREGDNSNKYKCEGGNGKASGLPVQCTVASTNRS